MAQDAPVAIYQGHAAATFAVNATLPYCLPTGGVCAAQFYTLIMNPVVLRY
jgi:hypothetical protein